MFSHQHPLPPQEQGFRDFLDHKNIIGVTELITELQDTSKQHVLSLPACRYIPRISSTSSTKPILSISSASSRTRNFNKLKSMFPFSM
jgi:hypothetical protein